MRLRLLDEAIREIEEAAAYLNRQEPDERLGLDFLTVVDELFVQIIENPRRFPVVEETRQVRRTRTHRFRYVVEYVTDGDVVTVLAVKHTSRHPDYGRDRRP